jgi:hypothetical protein
MTEARKTPPGFSVLETSDSSRTQNVNIDPNSACASITQALATSSAAAVSNERVVDWTTFDPSTLDTGGDDSLQAELITYKKKLPELLQHEGEFVLIKGDTIVGYFPTLRAALNAGAEKFREEPTFVKKIVRTETVIPAEGLSL